MYTMYTQYIYIYIQYIYIQYMHNILTIYIYTYTFVFGKENGVIYSYILLVGLSVDAHRILRSGTALPGASAHDLRLGRETSCRNCTRPES